MSPQSPQFPLAVIWLITYHPSFAVSKHSFPRARENPFYGTPKETSWPETIRGRPASCAPKAGAFVAGIQCSFVELAVVLESLQPAGAECVPRICAGAAIFSL